MPWTFQHGTQRMPCLWGKLWSSLIQEQELQPQTLKGAGQAASMREGAGRKFQYLAEQERRTVSSWWCLPHVKADLIQEDRKLEFLCQISDLTAN